MLTDRAGGTGGGGEGGRDPGAQTSSAFDEPVNFRETHKSHTKDPTWWGAPGSPQPLTGQESLGF